MTNPNCTRCGRFGHAAEACTTEPQPMQGRDLGGMNSLDRIKGRCRVDDITGCWNWTGATSSGRPTASVPVAWSAAHSAVVSVLRLSYGFHKPKEKLDKRMVWRKCANNACVNPEHLMAGTRKQWGQWVKDQGTRQDTQGTASRLHVRIATGKTQLTMELAQWVRESTQTGKAIAQALGCSETQISRARLMRCWAPVVPAGSVFAWAANQGRKAA